MANYNSVTGNNLFPRLSPDSLLQRYRKSLSSLNDSTKYTIAWPPVSAPKLSIKRPFQINGGNITYLYDYRSQIDTPYADRNVSQHSLLGRTGVTLFNALPLDISFFIRRSNSYLFADINDVRVDFNAARYAQTVRDNYIKQLNQVAPGLKDSLLHQLRKFHASELAKIMKRITDTDFRQRLVECNEIIRIPGIAESIAGPGKADSVRQRAREFMEAYQEIKKAESSYRNKIDSLQNLVNSTVARGQMLRELLSGKMNSSASPGEVMELLREQGIEVPASIRHLLALRRFSLGRSQLNYSELTARNLGINGINIEYSSWYYFALAAGTVDYRFRDFLLTRFTKKPQTMFLVRLGVGRLEKNHIILSFYRGQKQSFIQNNNNQGRSSTLTVHGMSLAAKYRLNKNSYLTGEIAQSATPGVALYAGQKASSIFDWRNKIDKAYAAKLYAYFPKTRSRLEAMYRYNGAAFQSFDRFQTNSAREIWYVKGEQFFWKRQVRLSFSLRSNEFNNPYISVPYSSSTVLKSVQLTFRKRKWPILSAGLMPFSQLSIVDDQVVENRFHTFNAMLYHYYKIGAIRSSTTATYNRFYNNAVDTSFIYFNATNMYVQQYFYFRKMTLSAGGSRSVNTGFELNTLEESIQLDVLKKASVSLGLKITNYNKSETRLGSWVRIMYRFMKTGSLQIHYENGFLPGNRNTLVRNELCSIMLTKTF